MVPNERIDARSYLCIIVNICLTEPFQRYWHFSFKKQLMPSHVTRNVAADTKHGEIFCA